MFLNTFKIRYNLIVVIEGVEEAGPLAAGGPPKGGLPQRRGTILKVEKKAGEDKVDAGGE